MIRSWLLVLLTFCVWAACLFAQDAAPRLLLTPKRLHRLKLDAGRHTERWNNLERQVKTGSNSPERGFELALYAVVSGDTTSCRAAVEWAEKHSAGYSQNALIADWCRTQITESDRAALLKSTPSFDAAAPFRSARNVLFHQIALDGGSRSQAEELWSRLLPLIQHDPRVCLPDLLALFEFIDAAHSNFRIDLRQQDAPLFSNLPSIFLLSLSPAQVEKPDWHQRAGALMMVNVDPNLQPSSFVQGWAMEDPKVVADGPGVGYEFLLANPYLPGLGYYNMDPWVYDQPSSLLLARTAWDEKSCWVIISPARTQTFQCAPDVLAKSAQFGKLSLTPMEKDCLEIASSQGGATTILSHLPPGEELDWESGDDKFKTQADASGLALVSSAIHGTVCQASSSKKAKGGKGHSK